LVKISPKKIVYYCNISSPLTVQRRGIERKKPTTKGERKRYLTERYK